MKLSQISVHFVSEQWFVWTDRSMAPPSADMAEVEEEEVISNGLANGAGYVTLSEGATEAPSARAQGTVVTINGVEITVFGNVQGLELLNLGGSTGPEVDVDAVDPEEEEEEARQREAAERAIREAEEADAARRSAPLPMEQCETIREAMRGITLDFRPEWAGSVPEQEWMNRILAGEKRS